MSTTTAAATHGLSGYVATPATDSTMKISCGA
jgi:hypothetical protein